MMRKIAPLPGVKLASREGELVTVRARIATLSAVDSDGDTYEPGAFAGNDDVPLGVYGHGSWGTGAGAAPIGRGAVVERGGYAEFLGVIALTSESARTHAALLEAMASTQPWSYGYDVLKFRHDTRDGKTVRVLQALRVHEVCPVLAAAGIGTRTLSLGGVDLADDDEVYRQFARFVRASL